MPSAYHEKFSKHHFQLQMTGKTIMLLSLALLILMVSDDSALASAFTLSPSNSQHFHLHSSKLSSSSLYAKQYGKNFQRRKYKNTFKSRSIKSKNLIHEIESANSCFYISNLILKNSNLFNSNDAVKALVQKISLFRPTMKCRDISGLLNVLSKARVPPSSRLIHQKLMTALGELSVNKMHEFEARDISMTLNALAKRNIQSPKVFEKASEAAISIMDEFKSQELANLVNAYAKMGLRHDVLFDQVARAAIHIIDSFNAQDIANFVNAYARINHHHPVLFDKVAEIAIPILYTFKAQELANTVNGFAKINHRHVWLFDEVAKSAIPIINKFTSQGLGNIVNAYAKMDHSHPLLFDEVAKAAPSIIHTFHAQDLANTVNAYAKAGHRHPALFDKVANAAINTITIFKAQELANIVNAFAKMDHHSPALFHEVAKSSIQILDQFTGQGLANLASAFSRNRMECQSTRMLFDKIAVLIKDDPDLLSKWKDVHLVGLGYALMKVRHMDTNLIDTIGTEIISRDRLLLDMQGWCNLAAAFGHFESPTTAIVLEKVFRSFQTFGSKVNLQAVADVIGAIPTGQRLQVVASGFPEDMAKLAISKLSEARPEEVRDIIIRFSRISLDPELQKEVLETYRPSFDKYSTKLNPKRRAEIYRIYREFDNNEDKENSTIDTETRNDTHFIAIQQDNEKIECLYSWLQRKLDGVNLLETELMERGIDFESNIGINALKRLLRAKIGDGKSSFRPQSKKLLEFCTNKNEKKMPRYFKNS
jgi:hypothetical protein